MFEFEGIIASYNVTSALLVASVSFIVIALSLAAWLLIERATGRRPAAARAGRRETAATLVVAVMFLLAGVGISLISAHRQAAAAPAAAMSIDEIHRRIDMKALPVQAVADFL